MGSVSLILTFLQGTTQHIVKFEILTEEDRENLADWSNLCADQD